MKTLVVRAHIKLGAILFLALAGTASAQTLRVIDVLGVYPDHTAQRVSDPVAMFAHNIEYANTALRNSGANYRYNLVHVAQVNWERDGSIGSSQLESLKDNGTIAAMREEHGADLVAGLVPQSNGLCGIGYLAIKRNASELHPFGSNYAFSLTGHSCGGRSMAHELGHNMGLGHSYAQGSSGTLAPWARGHGVRNTFVTIMAYGSAYAVGSSGRLQVHSTPALRTCSDLLCGKSISQQDGAHAVRAMNLGSVQIAQYRDSVEQTPNLAPDAVADDTETEQDQAVTLNVLANDSDPDGDAISLVSISSPRAGDAEKVNNRGDIRYTPDPGFYGEDVFDYTIQDAKGASSSARVEVTVKQAVINNPPSGGDNLIANGNLEANLDGWFGLWNMTVKRTSNSLQGAASVAARDGYGVGADLDTPFSAARKFELTSVLKASQNNQIYLYLRVLSQGRWSYRYLGYKYAPAGRRVTVKKSFELKDQKIDDGYLLFYVPNRARGTIRIDSTTLRPQ